MNRLEEITSAFTSQYGDKISAQPVFRNETTLVVDKSILFDVLKSLKQSHQFDYLVDISGVDNFGNEPRFEVVYELYSYPHQDHLRIKTAVSEDDNKVPSVMKIWATANWHERECYDMFGIKFDGHPDLRRILMWEGYPYFPLRKDFPLEGKPTNMPDVAFTGVAPLEGGPFITAPAKAVKDREPRARQVEEPK